MRRARLPDKSTYFPGERVLSKLETNNTSTKGTRKLVIRVHRSVTMRAQGSRLVIPSVVYEHLYLGFDPMFYGERCVR